MNGGVCFENADTYTCQCANNFHGQHCAGNFIHFKRTLLIKGITGTFFEILVQK